MASNALDPSEWPSIVERIRNGDTNIGGRLSEREARFDNFFAYFEYTPTVIQDVTAVSTSLCTAQVFRLGPKVQVFFQVAFSGAGTVNGGLRISIPADLPIFGSAFTARLTGTMVFNDQNTGTNYVGIPFSIGTGYVYQVDDGATNVFGASPALTVANLDAWYGDFEYITSATGLF